ncbi:MAG: General secretion pathway protein K [Syntrophorhabdaceae bacterium PtaU1.Bin034]|nr:MAG: General secretion pathway protein K [Syntrophorhabdaceae bacterium PtaU1.Bin034]
MQKGKIENSRPKKACKALSNEGGFILVTVLLVIALLFPLVLAFNSKVQLNLIQAENFRNSVQALRIAHSGVEGVMGILKEDDAVYDSRKDKWGMAFPGLAIAEGILNVNTVDEDGKIPINNLVGIAVDPTAAKETTAKESGIKEASGTVSKTGTTTEKKVTNDDIDRDLEKRLKSLITRLGGKPEIVDALIDWLDSNDEVTGSEGAEDHYYKQQGYRCKNGPLDSLDELLLIKGFDKELVIDAKLKDYLTIAPTDGKININTAPLEVLYAVLGTETTGFAQPLSDSDLENLAQYREQHELTNIQEVTFAVKISQDQAGKMAPLIKVNSAFFTVNSRYTIGKVVKNVEALLKRDGSTVATISWREF